VRLALAFSSRPSVRRRRRRPANVVAAVAAVDPRGRSRDFIALGLGVVAFSLAAGLARAADPRPRALVPEATVR